MQARQLARCWHAFVVVTWAGVRHMLSHLPEIAGSGAQPPNTTSGSLIPLLRSPRDSRGKKLHTRLHVFRHIWHFDSQNSTLENSSEVEGRGRLTSYQSTNTLNLVVVLTPMSLLGEYRLTGHSHLRWRVSILSMQGLLGSGLCFYLVY